MIKAGAVTGLSIGFQTKKASRSAKGRTITEAELIEISVVAVPAHPGARITNVKSTSPRTHEQENTHMDPEDLELETRKEDQPPANDAPKVDTKAFNDMKARLDKLEAKAARPRTAAPDTKAIVPDELKAFTDFLRTGDTTEVKALAYGTGTGGILAPETVSKNILEKIAEYSPVRRIASTLTMGGPLLQLPRLVTRVAPASVAEGAAKPESEPTFEQIDLKPFEMGVVVPVNKVLLEDAHIDLAGYLGDHIAQTFGHLEASWFVTGDGTTQAEGVLTSTEVLNVDAAATTLDADDILNAFYNLKTAYATRGAWLMNRNTMALLRAMKGLDGQYFWQPGLADGQPTTLLGRPIYEAVDMPDPAPGNVPIVFGDFRTGYTVADRVGFDLIRDDYTGATTGLVKFIARRRVGGRVVMGEALTKLSIPAS